MVDDVLKLSGGSDVNRSAATSKVRARPVISAGLLPALLLGLAACGSASDPDSDPVAGSQGVPPSELCEFLHQEVHELNQEPSKYEERMLASLSPRQADHLRESLDKCRRALSP